jgi:hypothetical protein
MPAKFATAVVSLVALGFATPALGASPWFSGIGDLEGGPFQSRASSVSNTGLVVGYGTIALNQTRPVTWTLASGLALMPVDALAAIDVSADGSTILLRGAIEDLVWTAGTGAIGLGEDQLARALSADGATVVGRRERPDLATVEAFRWTLAGGVEGLGFLPHTNESSEAYAVSTSGDVATGDSRNYTDAPGFLWTAVGGIEPLAAMPDQGQPRFTRAMSKDGTTLAGLVDNSVLFVWSESAGYQYLADFDPSHGKWPRDLDQDGTVMVGGSVSNDHPTAFHWTAAEGMRPLGEVLADDYGLDVEDWMLHDAVAISPNGRYIVGVGTNPDGRREGFVAFLGSPACGLGGEVAWVLPVLVLLRRRFGR